MSCISRCSLPSSDCDANDDVTVGASGRFYSCAILRRELKFRKLLWNLTDANYFLYSQLFPVWVLWLVRLSLTVIFLATLVHVFVASAVVAIEDAEEVKLDAAGPPNSSQSASVLQYRHHFAAYLTYWNFLVTCVYLCGASALMVCARLRSRRGPHAYSLCQGPYLTPGRLRATRHRRRPASCLARLCLQGLWLAMHAAYTGSVLVTCVGLGHSLRRPTFARLFMHGCNCLLLFAEAAVGGLPFRLAFLAWVEVGGFTYLGFTWLYWRLDKQENVLYPGLLDWNYPWMTAGAMALVSCLFTPGIHTSWWLTAGRLRYWLGARRLKAATDCQQL